MFTYLLSKINVDFTALCKTNIQIIGSTLILPTRFAKRVLLSFDFFFLVSELIIDLIAFFYQILFISFPNF